MEFGLILSFSIVKKVFAILVGFVREPTLDDNIFNNVLNTPSSFLTSCLSRISFI